MTESKTEFKRVMHGGKPYSVTLKSDQPQAAEILEAAWNGSKWMRFNKGKLESLPYYQTPEPVVDEEMEPFWPVVKTPPQEKLLFSGGECHLPGIFVKHIEGYTGGYDEKAVLLEHCGFHCLRSRRSDSGRYWEVWYLPSALFTDGPIKGMKIDEIRKWLFRNISPGNVVKEGDCWSLSAPD